MPAITKRFVEMAEPGRHYDAKLAGFGLYVGRPDADGGSARSYFVEYRPGHGRGVSKRRYTIGRHGRWTADKARDEAKRLLAIVDGGGDPLAARESAKKATKLADVAAEWLVEIDTKRKPRTAFDYRRLFNCRILPTLGTRDVAKIERQDIARLHHAMRGTPYEANHALRVASSFFTWTERAGYRPDGSNPCRHVDPYPEKRRERFLSPRELQRLARVLRVVERSGLMSPYVVAAVRLLVFTGARLSEILTLRWEHVEADRALLRLPDSKTGQKVIYLSGPALDVLAKLPRVRGNPHVIVGGKEGAHLVNLEKPWLRLRKAALLADVRLHDLRHSHASVAAASGLSLPLIGALLGHSQPATTARYAHLAADPVRAAAEMVGQRIAAAMTGDRSAEVIPMQRR
ncbi:tyrosine-type recombinase/integrase [Geminicoccus flavidas]|uniref:tyrosine-type recombinase/integrase n=1 Tax=Geminicoccus flavidas TaxID=2506407 RepID=UPI00210505F6|nr:site-specific integrase [Geminicoccus flavidas]